MLTMTQQDEDSIPMSHGQTLVGDNEKHQHQSMVSQSLQLSVKLGPRSLRALICMAVGAIQRPVE
jgi:hypothetical protein